MGLEQSKIVAGRAIEKAYAGPSKISQWLRKPVYFQVLLHNLYCKFLAFISVINTGIYVIIADKNCVP